MSKLGTVPDYKLRKIKITNSNNETMNEIGPRNIQTRGIFIGNTLRQPMCRNVEKVFYQMVTLILMQLSNEEFYFLYIKV